MLEKCVHDAILRPALIHLHPHLERLTSEACINKVLLEDTYVVGIFCMFYLPKIMCMLPDRIF